MNGRVIGNYRIEHKLGEGGMGAVYKGVDTMLDREVAIKALRPELASQTTVVERFRSEAVTLAKLHHPNIATLYSLFRQDGELYMVLEYVRGETLDAILQRRGALPPEEVIPVFCQILDGINHAHEFGIVHRDIKPANMMLTEKGTLKVLDFGIARLLGSSRMTRAGNIIGTLEYMAPEQVKGLETDARTDIYALGMMLYEVLTGRAPFDTANEFELMRLQIEAMPPLPRTINSSIPEEVQAALIRAIQKDPGARFQTAGEFREALLSAGFAAQGVIRRITGSHSSQETAGLPPSSNSVATEKSPNNLKETRLAEMGTAATAKAVPKETRLGTNIEAAASSSMQNEIETSFFSKLTWVHYTGAGVAAVFVFALLIIIPVFVFSGNTSQENVIQAKPSVTPLIENKPQKAEVLSTRAPVVSSQPITEEVREPVITTPISEISNTPKMPAQPVETGTVKKASTKPTPKAQPVKTRRLTREQEIERARCKLIGNC